MFCPKCKNQVLNATKIEQGLSAMGCSVCDGAFVSLLYYRDWLENSTYHATPCELPQAEEVVDSKHALACPKCSKLMSKYRISGELTNRLDLCMHCGEAWLDGGEWELLKALELSRKMPTLFSEEWQKKLRKQESEKIRENRLLQLVSEVELEKNQSDQRKIKKSSAQTRNFILY